MNREPNRDTDNASPQYPDVGETLFMDAAEPDTEDFWEGGQGMAVKKQITEDGRYSYRPRRAITLTNQFDGPQKNLYFHCKMMVSSRKARPYVAMLDAKARPIATVIVNDGTVELRTGGRRGRLRDKVKRRKLTPGITYQLEIRCAIWLLRVWLKPKWSKRKRGQKTWSERLEFNGPFRNPGVSKVRIGAGAVGNSYYDDIALHSNGRIRDIKVQILRPM